MLLPEDERMIKGFLFNSIIHLIFWLMLNMDLRYTRTAGPHPSYIREVYPILWARLVQLHGQLHEQLHNFNSQTTNSLPNSLVSFSENSLSQS
jgi:hypothetical protein